jgi:hypothetical protein
LVINQLQGCKSIKKNVKEIKTTTKGKNAVVVFISFKKKSFKIGLKNKLFAQKRTIIGIATVRKK